MQEIISKRTMYEKHYFLGDGKYRVDNFSYPIHYLNDGQWVDVDTNVSKVKTWEFTEGVLESIFRVYFGDNTSENKHLFGIQFGGKSDRWINFKLKGASPTGKFYNENQYKFINCFDGIDVEYIVNPDFLKENIILNNPTDMREFVFTMKSSGTKIGEKDGGLVVVDKETGQTLWTIDKPYMVDANGNQSFGVAYTIDNDGEFDTFTVQVTDEDFLSSAVYPVAIDPSVIVADNTNSIHYTSANFGATQASGFTMETFHCGQNSFGALYFKEIDKYKGKFGTHIFTKATISLYCTQGRGIPVDVYNVSQSQWGSGIAYPTKTATRWYNFASVERGWTDIDILSQLSDSFYGIWFVTTGISHCWFATPTYATASQRPKLTLEYYVRPSLVFVDENNDFYTSGNGQTIFKYLDFGMIQAGMTAPPQKVYLRNLTGFDVKNVQIWIETAMNDGVTVELSKSQNPFVPEDVLQFSNGLLADGSDVVFYVRVVSDEFARAGGNYTIRSKADTA